MPEQKVRLDGRRPDELRPLCFTTDYVDYPHGSVLVEMGKTRVLCNVCVEEKVPDWMAGRGVGWLTAEYSMLPQSTQKRNPRETNGLKGRTQEIRRLIGRSLRAAVDLSQIGERTLLIDCDVIQADGGTRTASINGSYVALAIAVNKLTAQGLLPASALLPPVAAVSVGMVNGYACLDLNYGEDSSAEVDLNVVMTADGKFIEVQGTAEKEPYDRRSLNAMLDLAEQGIREILILQQAAIYA
ncbi:ribonuclease PH [Ornatilinea apprima]|uniref:Ribonuclease PH n=1 Tax=Ornatilinea apprima TaxID=1134406 RepID=A0A0P6X6T8_9CHLR|nr:ribonuclease PH [Ornatilinea apprima]KPL78774.1 ribonuclease PH [Ornatilinea apprima]